MRNGFYLPAHVFNRNCPDWAFHESFSFCTLWFYIFSHILSIAAQVLIPFISNLVCPRKSAELVGILMSGLLMGILSARTIAGLVSTMWSWHYIYLGSGITILLFALVMWKRFASVQ